MNEVLPPLRAKYGDRLEIKLHEIAQPSEYELMVAYEDYYALVFREIPEFFIGNVAIVGEEAIRRDLEPTIDRFLAEGGKELPIITVKSASAGSDSAINVAYFFTTGCGECDRVKYDLGYLKTRYSNLVVTELDITQPENKALNEAIGQRLGVPTSERLLTPSIYVGESYLVGKTLTTTDLADTITKYSGSGASAFWNELDAEKQAAQSSISSRFLSFGVAPVLAAGLIDGLNPCAFATVIFFVSYLTVAGRRGREILIVGAAFTLGVFLAYLLIGLGLLQAIKSLSILVTVAKFVYLVTGLFCLVFAILNVRDYIRIRRGSIADMSLQLPSYLKNRVRSIIRENAKVRQFVIGAFASGFIISILELLCTGQVYLPTIVYVVGIPELRAQATLYLLLYNLMFVVPLIVVFLLTYFGATSKDFTAFLQKRAATIKLLLAFVFVALGGWLVYAAV